MVPTVWVAGAFTAAMLAALVNWLLTFIAPPFIIWIKQTHSCRGMYFGTQGGAAGQLLALALVSEDTPSAVAGMVTTTNTLQSPEMRLWRIKNDIITKPRIHSCASMAQCGIVDTAAVEALSGDVTAQVLVEMLVERGLLQYSEDGKCYVTGELVIQVNGILNLLGYGPDAYVDAASITNSWMHLVLSCPVMRKMILKIICSSCMFGRIGQEVTDDTPELCAAYVAAADEIRSTARSLAAAIKAKDLRSVNLLVPKLKEMMHALVPALVKTYPKEALEKTWSKIEAALYRQRDVDTPAFLRELHKCDRAVDVVVALRPGDMIPSQPLRPPTVLIVRDVKKVDLELLRTKVSSSKVLESIGSKAMALGAAALAEGFGDVGKLPAHETPLSILEQTQTVLLRNHATKNSLAWSRSGMMAAVDPITGRILFRTDRLDAGHPFLDAAYIKRHAIDAVTTGAYRDLRQLAAANRAALLRAAAEEASARKAHGKKVASLLDEAYASRHCPEVVVFLGQAGDAVAKGRAFANRDALEELFASMGVPCFPLLEGQGGIDTRVSISDVERYIYRALPPHLRARRRRVVVVFPERHVYPEDPEGMGHNLAEYLARKCRVFSETVARAAFDDVRLLDDLDSPLLVPHKPFVPVDEIFLENHQIANPLATTMPKVMFNAAAGFKSKADVAREAAEKRKAELDDVVAPGEFRLLNRDAQKKEAFNYEDFLKPGGVWNVARLEEVKTGFETQLERYQLAVSAKTRIPSDFWNWRGHAEKSRNNLADALDCMKPKGSSKDRMEYYAGKLDEKIKELKASAAG